MIGLAGFVGSILRCEGPSNSQALVNLVLSHKGQLAKIFNTEVSLLPISKPEKLVKPTQKYPSWLAGRLLENLT